MQIFLKVKHAFFLISSLEILNPQYFGILTILTPNLRHHLPFLNLVKSLAYQNYSENSGFVEDKVHIWHILRDLRRTLDFDLAQPWPDCFRRRKKVGMSHNLIQNRRLGRLTRHYSHRSKLHLNFIWYKRYIYFCAKYWLMRRFLGDSGHFSEPIRYNGGGLFRNAQLILFNFGILYYKITNSLWFQDSKYWIWAKYNIENNEIYGKRWKIQINTKTGRMCRNNYNYYSAQLTENEPKMEYSNDGFF